ncbi:MAG: hypothetical protein WCW84_05115 [Sulfurimonas sp.]|jgi:predicted DNA-binding transcriptional regulator AlpA
MSAQAKILSMLEEKYGSILLTKKDLSQVMGCSLSTIDNLLKIGKNIPKHIKFGDAKNSSIRFCNIDVAEFLATSAKEVEK